MAKKDKVTYFPLFALIKLIAIGIGALAYAIYRLFKR